MRCCYCNCKLTGFDDARIIHLKRGEKAVCCTDLAACGERRDAGEKQDRDRAPGEVIAMPQRGGGV